MAKTKKSRSVAVRTVSPVRRYARRARSGIAGVKKASWIEIGITALAGYFAGTALQDSGVASMALANSKVGPYLQDAMTASDKRSGPTLAEMIGIVVGAKGIYDLVEGKKSVAIQAELPFAIGTFLGPGGA